MNQSSYQIGDYRFFTQEEYKASLNDIKKIRTLMTKADLTNPKVATKLYQQLLMFPDMFETVIGEDFVEKLLQCSEGQPVYLGRLLKLFVDKPVIQKEVKAIILQEENKVARVEANELNQETESATETKEVRQELASVAESEEVKQELASVIEREEVKQEIASVAETEEVKQEIASTKETDEREQQIAIIAKVDEVVQEAENITKTEEGEALLSDIVKNNKLQKEKEKKIELPVKQNVITEIHYTPFPFKKKLAIFIAGAMAGIFLFNIGSNIHYNIVSYFSTKRLEALAACILEPIEAEVSKEHIDMDILASATDNSKIAEDHSDNDQIATMEELDILGIQDVLEEKDKEVLYQYSALYEKNNDIVGWIRIDETVVNYPVMQTKDDEEYYLNRNFDKEEDVNGLPFMDIRCAISNPTSNTIIYGHNMKNGSMFATLLKYKNEDFYKEHKIIHFDSIYEQAEYEIIAAFQTRVAYENEDVFRFYRFIDAEDEIEYNNYIREIKAIACYDTEVNAVFGEQLLTLATCDRSIEDGRFIVVARKILSRNNEKSA